MAFLLGTAGVGSLTFLYNYWMMGDARAFPIMAYTNRLYGPNANALGFGPDRGMGWAIDAFPGHSPLEAVLNTGLNAFLINYELFGWAAGSLVLVLVFLSRLDLRRPDFLMLSTLLLIVFVHGFYYFNGGPDFGARYWFLGIVPLVALTARAVEYWGYALSEDQRSLNGRVLAAVGLMSLVALLTFLPWRALDKYHHYRDMRPDVRRLAETHRFGRSLVLIEGDRDTDYASAATYNPVDLSASVPIYAWSRDPGVAADVVRVYRDRPVWIVAGPSKTGLGFEIVRGPVTASALLEELTRP